MKKLIFTLLLLSTPVYAQSSPNLITGQIPTAAQWNSYFAAKQDVLGYTPMNTAGGTFTGRVVTAAPGVTTAGFNMSPGTTPGSPANGDLWVTSSGIFARVNGVTVNLAAAGSGNLTVGTTTIGGGTTARILYDNAGVLGEYSVTGTGTTAVLSNAPTIVSLSVTGSFTATGLVTNADLVNSSVTVNGTTCTLGSSCSPSAASSLVVGSSTVTGGTTTRVLYDNAGVLGEYVITGTGNVVMSASPTLTGTVIGQSVNLTPTGISGLTVTSAISGTTTGHQYLNRFNVTSDAVDTTNDTLAAFGVTHSFGGATVSGFRYGVQSILTLTTATKTSGAGNLAQPVYTGGLFGFQPNSNDNGTGGTPRSAGIGLNAYMVAQPAATNFDTLLAISADISTPSGVTPRYRAGINIMEEGSVAQATTYDTALGISGIAGGQIGFKNAILIGPLLFGGTAPLSSTATILATTGSATIAKGIDWSSYTFTGNQFTGVGSSISSIGYGEFTSGVGLKGSSSGEIFINVANAAGGYNFNLPILQATAIGLPLLSGTASAFGTTPMTFGVLGAPAGGTGQSSYAVGDLLYASTTTALSKLADVAIGQPLLSGGVSTAPAYAGLKANFNGSSGSYVNANAAAPASGGAGMVWQVSGADSVNAVTLIDSFGTGFNSYLTTRAARGTAASFSAVQSGDGLGFFGMIGATGTNTFPSAVVGAGGVYFGGTATENWSGGANGSRIDFYTTTNGTASVNKRMQLAEGLTLGGSTDPGANGLRVTGATIQFTSITSTAQTNVLCFNSGTGLVTFQTWASGCVTSSARFKDIISEVTPEQGMAVMLGATGYRYKYKSSANLGDDTHFGFTADQMATVDRDLVTFEEDGQTHGVKYQEMWAFAAAAFKQLKADNDNLQDRIIKLEKEKR